MAKTKWHKFIAGARKNYPNPVSLSHMNDYPRRGCYCVGGAICQSMGRDVNFPGPSALEWALFQVNPNLKGRLSRDYANQIILANDQGHFTKAWETADEACKLGGPRRDRLSQLTDEHK